MARKYIAHGFRKAVKPGSAAEKDLLALTGEAKRKRAAARKEKPTLAKPSAGEEAMRARGRQEIKKMKQRAAAKKLAKESPEIQKLRKRVTAMRLRAKEVRESGTGNVGAAKTYLQVARELEKRLSALRAK